IKLHQIIVICLLVFSKKWDQTRHSISKHYWNGRQRMKFQGEVLDYFDVQKVVSNIFGGAMHAKRIQSVANAALGVVAGGSLIIHRIGRGLAKADNLSDKHAIKQVDRL